MNIHNIANTHTTFTATWTLHIVFVDTTNIRFLKCTLLTYLHQRLWTDKLQQNVWSASVTAKETCIHLLTCTKNVTASYCYTDISGSWVKSVNNYGQFTWKYLHCVSKVAQVTTVDNKQFLVWVYQLMTYQFTCCMKHFGHSLQTHGFTPSCRSMHLAGVQWYW